MLDSTGLTIKRLPEIISDLESLEQQLISANIATGDDTLLGQLNNIYGAALAELWELAESVNSNFDLDKAEGRNLEDLAIYAGNLLRLQQEKSKTTKQQFIGDQGSVIPISTLLQAPATLERVLTTAVINLDSNSCTSTIIAVDNVFNNTLYTVTVNTVDYDFTSDADATANEIVTGLKGLIDADVTATWTATLIGDTLVITTDDDDNNINVALVLNLSISSVTVLGNTEAENFGGVLFPLNSVTTIVLPVSGLISTTNTEAYITGRLDETDEEFRLRISKSQQAGGSATLEAITDNLLEVTGVSTVEVTENNTSATVNGIPPHEFEAVVLGGTDAGIALSIFNNKAAGIGSFGNTTEVVIDSFNNSHNISFTRPTTIHIAFRVSYTLYNEESFPIDGKDLIKTVVKDTLDSLTIDEDVIPNRFFGPIYAAVDGIDSLIVEIQTLANQGDTPVGGSWQETRIAISEREISSTVVTDMTVLEI